jgi:hypothetical protein
MVNALTTPDYSVEQLTSSPGLFFDHLGTLRYHTSHWEIITYYNITHINTQITYAKWISQITQALCLYTRDTSEGRKCIAQLSTTASKFDRIDNLHQSLFQITGTNKVTRAKRGLINGIGSLAKSLFGTLDYEDAEYYDNMIDKLNSNERNVIELVKEQINIVASTIENFNQTVSSFRTNEFKFNKNIEYLNKYIHDSNDRFSHIESIETLHVHLLSLFQLINELETQLETIISSILFAKTNSIHPSIITPEQIFKELVKTPPYLPKGVEYPVTLEIQNIHKLLDLSQVQIYHSDDKLIFKISIPLTDNTIFNLYNLLPLPTSIGTSFISIHPKNKYLAYSESKTQYSLLDSIDNCKLLSKQSFICPYNHMIYSGHAKPSCETLLLTASSIPKSCLLQQTHGPLNMWHRLWTKNRWIFVLTKPMSLTINCDSRVNDLKLANVGILTLGPNCKGYSPEVLLISENVNSSEVNVITPNINIAKDDCCSEAIVNRSLNIPLLYPIHFSTASLDDLHLVSHKINSFSEDIDKILHHSPANRKTNIFHWVMFSILILVIAFIILKLYLKKGKVTRNRNPISIQGSRTSVNSATNAPEGIELNPLRRSARLQANIKT